MRLRLAVVGNQAKETREAQGGAEEAKEAQEGRRAQEERQAHQAQELRQAQCPPSHLTWMPWQQKSLQGWALGQLAAVAVAAAMLLPL